MLQPILTPEKLWPGGIPSSVRPHPNGELTDGPEESDWKDWKEECKGWCQFVEEKWVPMTDLNEEMQQRRALIATWASAHQEFRDSYQGRAPSRNSALDYPQHLLSKVELGEKRFFCLASVDKEQDADNYSRLVKSLILLYLHDDQGTGHPLKHAAGESPQIPDLLADSSTTSDYTKFFSYHDLLFNLYLHPADFRAISMTRSGTVIFPEQYSNIPYTVISQDNLNQGRVAVMTFKPNGTIGQYANLISWNFTRVMSYYHGLAWPFSEIFNYEHSGCPFAAPYLNEPINMNEPLLDIVKFLMQRGDLHVFRGSMADWEQQIRKFAPGYLELEAQGQEVEFDLANLWNEKRLRYSHHTNDLRRRPIPQ